jgi:general secretion pathway protein G
MWNAQRPTRTSRLSFEDRGFTLIEVVMVIVIIGILAGVSIPTFQDMGSQAKAQACRQSLMSMRTAIEIWRMNNIAKYGSIAWPSRDTLAAVGKVLSHQIPPNPFQTKTSAPDSIVTGVTKGVVVGTRGGWAYKASTGEIWPNTSSSATVSGCSGATSVGENNW